MLKNSKTFQKPSIFPWVLGGSKLIRVICPWYCSMTSPKHGPLRVTPHLHYSHCNDGMSTGDCDKNGTLGGSSSRDQGVRSIHVMYVPSDLQLMGFMWVTSSWGIFSNGQIEESTRIPIYKAIYRGYNPTYNY